MINLQINIGGIVVKKRIGLLVVGIITLFAPLNVNAQSVDVYTSKVVEENKVLFIPSTAYVFASYKTYLGPRAYVRQVVGGGHYGGFVPYLGSDLHGFHYYGGLAPLIGANPYSVDIPLDFTENFK